jgi:hypothetical protein
LRAGAGVDMAGSAVVAVVLTTFVDTKAGQPSLARQRCEAVPKQSDQDPVPCQS